MLAMAVSTHIVGMSAARGMAAYLYSGAITLTPEQGVALAVLNERMTELDAMAELEKAAVQHLTDRYRQMMEGVSLALRDEGEHDLAAIASELAHLDPEIDWERFDEMSERLRFALEVMDHEWLAAPLDQAIVAWDNIH